LAVRSRAAAPARAFELTLLLLLSCAPDPPSASHAAPFGAFPNRREPFALPGGDLGIVANNGSDQLTLLDLEGRAVLGSAPAGRNPVDLDGPHHVAVDRARGLVFTALAYPVPTTAPGPHAGHGVSQRPGQVLKLALDDFRPLGMVRIDTNPGDIVLSDDGRRLVVSHFDLLRATRSDELEEQRATLAVLDPDEVRNEDEVAPRLLTTCVAPHGVALSRPAGEFAFVACYGEDAVAIVDTSEGGAEPVLVSVGPGGTPGNPLYGPYSAVLSHDGRSVALGNTESNDVRFLDVDTRNMLSRTLPCDGAPYFPAWSADDRRLFVPTQDPDGLVVFELGNDRPLRRRSFRRDECERPHEVTFTSDESTLFVVCEGDRVTPSVVLALDPETLETFTTLPVGVYPDRLVVGSAP
jgi:DNA-binding beta-propeller fold protein YncE